MAESLLGAGAQQAASPAAAGIVSLSPLNMGTSPSERKLSHAMPCGSVIQYLSDLA
jgi:hypothetical protein